MEKESEYQLRTLLKEQNFNNSFLFNSPSENETLKVLFKNSSKSGNSYGIPDCIYYDGLNLIIMECKSHSFTFAEKDYIFYYNTIKNNSLTDNIIKELLIASIQFYKIYN